MRRTRVFILLFLGFVITTTAVGMSVSSVKAQTKCYDAQGATIPCPPPNNGGGGGGGRRKPTKTPYPSYTPAPTKPVPAQQPYPYPGPYPYPNPGGGPVISPTLPPYGICVFCDRPWLWGLGGIVIVLLLGAVVFRFFTGGVGPGPDPGPENINKKKYYIIYCLQQQKKIVPAVC